ncbi:PAS domain-containing sensor histidine kinase [Bauldia litoralis]|uniref:Blue-light-activated histidine kinase n=1 Tax=Bauldia litoralis TaxID=665467 RepID=A0A1G6BQZ2_9HYPH|nr:GAF domain-containing protein [Bauldia litoralis]SDB23026.1 Two-component sensor histidine kinase, contains HisKA and HATPase domains [Bauldia litoralis]
MKGVHDIGATLQGTLARPISSLPFFDVIEALPAAIYTTDANGRIDLYNHAAVTLWGREPVGDERFWCGPHRLFTANGALLPHDRSPTARALQTGQAIAAEEIAVERADGTRVALLSYPTPLRNEHGAIIGTITMMVDISDRKAAEIERDRRLVQLEALSELGILAMSSDDLDALFDQAVALLSKGLNVEFAKVLELSSHGQDLHLRAGIGWKDGIVGKARVGTDRESQAGYTLSIDEPVIVEDLATETRFSGPRLLLDHKVTSGLSVIIRQEDGRAFGVLGAHTSARRQFTGHDVNFLQSVANILSSAIGRVVYRDRQTMLMRELSHRMKNNMAVIHSLARQSGRDASNVADYVDRFEGRLATIEAAQDLLTDADGTGVALSALLSMVIGSQSDAGSVTLEVDDVDLGPSGVQTMSLLLYELMTNAVKYGAFSDGGGRVAITGRRDGDGHYALTWAESGGPPVEEPSREGFGSRLVVATVERQWGGTISRDWRREGLVVNCALPLQSITGQGAPLVQK